jgi:hypothetical protein
VQHLRSVFAFVAHRIHDIVWAEQKLLLLLLLLLRLLLDATAATTAAAAATTTTTTTRHALLRKHVFRGAIFVKEDNAAAEVFELPPRCHLKSGSKTR